MAEAGIIERLETAMDKARWRDAHLKLLYLTEEDWVALDEAMSAKFDVHGHFFSYRNVPIRRGEKSRFFDIYGASISVSKRLSEKVAQRLAA